MTLQRCHQCKICRDNFTEVLDKYVHHGWGAKKVQNTYFIILKLVSAIFYQFVFLTKWQPFKNYEKCFLFHLKSSFRSRDIQIFVFLSSPLFLPVSHCFRGWSKINLQVYDIICINKNLITHFVWYLEKEKRYDMETLPIDRVLNKEHFPWKIMQKMFIRG